MNDEMEIFFDKSDGTSFIESLAKSRQWLKDNNELSSKLDNALNLELDLAILEAEKAKSNLLKNSKDNKLVPIK